MTDCDIKITEEDLRIFPPYVSLFLLVTLFMMVSHGFGATLLFIIYLDIPRGYDFGATMVTILIFVVLNMRLIYGHLSSVIGLQILAACYFVIAAAYFFIDVEPLPVWLPGTVMATSGGAIAVIRSRHYGIMVEFIVRRWRFYRTTGRTILEEIDRQRREQHSANRR